MPSIENEAVDVEGWMLSFFGAVGIDDFETRQGIDRIINRGRNEKFRVEAWYWPNFDHVRIFVYERDPAQDHLIYQEHLKFSQIKPFATGAKIYKFLCDQTNSGTKEKNAKI